MNKHKQNTNTILMIEPVGFHFNAETAENNYFQQKVQASTAEIQNQAFSEFKGMVSKLQSHGVTVLTIPDTLLPPTPDSIFPNNWFSTHHDGQVALYPMFAKNRRLERREDILNFLENEGYIINSVTDYSEAEKEGFFLEGTGSFVLDRSNRIAYAALSPRTDEDLFIEFCEDFEYTPVIFQANQNVGGEKKPIYHTNVMMCVGTQYAIIALHSIENTSERKKVAEFLKQSGKEIIEITEKQMHCFAGNMLQVKGSNEEKLLVMSQTAYDSLTLKQIATIEKYNKILSVEIPTIEKLGGGSARCMMAEIFLPKE